ncbi:RNA polymerase sigma factor [Planctomycetota bacterium]
MCQQREVDSDIKGVFDEPLLKQWRLGNQVAALQYIAIYQKPLYVFVRRSNLSEEDVEDVMQEIWIIHELPKTFW